MKLMRVLQARAREGVVDLLKMRQSDPVAFVYRNIAPVASLAKLFTSLHPCLVDPRNVESVEIKC